MSAEINSNTPRTADPAAQIRGALDRRPGVPVVVSGAIPSWRPDRDTCGIDRDIQPLIYLVHADPVAGRARNAGAGDGRAEQLDKLMWRGRTPLNVPEVHFCLGRLHSGFAQRLRGRVSEIPCGGAGQFGQGFASARGGG
jgi:hypothetical protein